MELSERQAEFLLQERSILDRFDAVLTEETAYQLTYELLKLDVYEEHIDDIFPILKIRLKRRNIDLNEGESVSKEDLYQLYKHTVLAILEEDPVADQEYVQEQYPENCTLKQAQQLTLRLIQIEGFDETQERYIWNQVRERILKQEGPNKKVAKAIVTRTVQEVLHEFPAHPWGYADIEGREEAPESLFEDPTPAIIQILQIEEAIGRVLGDRRGIERKIGVNPSGIIRNAEWMVPIG